MESSADNVPGVIMMLAGGSTYEVRFLLKAGAAELNLTELNSAEIGLGNLWRSFWRVLEKEIVLWRWLLP